MNQDITKDGHLSFMLNHIYMYTHIFKHRKYLFTKEIIYIYAYYERQTLSEPVNFD